MHARLLIFIVALVGFLINFQPSEPFLTVYLKDYKNLTSSVLDTQVWPADTYSALAFTIPIGFVAEIVGYIPTVFFGLFLREATRILLIFGQGTTAMVWVQVTYAGASAVNNVFYALPYILLPKGVQTYV